MKITKSIHIGKPAIFSACAITLAIIATTAAIITHKK
jgi:hypothetical protein